MNKTKRHALRVLRETVVNSPLLLSGRYRDQPGLFARQALTYFQCHPDHRLDMDIMNFDHELQACFNFYSQLQAFELQFRAFSQDHIVSQIAFNAVLATSKQVYRDFDADAATRVLAELAAHFADHMAQEFPNRQPFTRH